MYKFNSRVHKVYSILEVEDQAPVPEKCRSSGKRRVRFVMVALEMGRFLARPVHCFVRRDSCQQMLCLVRQVGLIYSPAGPIPCNHDQDVARKRMLKDALTAEISAKSKARRRRTNKQNVRRYL